MNLFFKKTPQKTSSKVLVTFTVDDGCSTDETKVSPVFKALGIPVCYGVRVTAENTLSYGTVPLDVAISNQNNYGFEYLSHTVRHLNLSTCTVEQVDYELSQPLAWMTAGLHIESLVYPYGGVVTNDMLRTAAKYYRSALSTRSSGNRGNTRPLHQFGLFRSAIDNKSLAQAQAVVRKAATSGVDTWVCYYLHSWKLDTRGMITTEDMSNLVEWVISEGHEIITVSDALTRMGIPAKQ